MHDELVKNLRESAEWADRLAILMGRTDGDTHAPIMREAADAIEQLIEERDAYRKAMTDEHNRAAKFAWEKEHCWISTEELLPKDLQNVLVIDNGRVTIGHCEHYYGEEQIFVEWHDTLYYPIDPPYWMPLPEPPKEEC